MLRALGKARLCYSAQPNPMASSLAGPKGLHRERYLRQALVFEAELRAYLYRTLHNRADTEDLLQETYARLLRLGDDDTQVVRSIRAIAFTTARNLLLDFARRGRARLPPPMPIESMTDADELHASAFAAGAESAVDAEQELKLLAAALEGMSPLSRQVFTLRKIYDYSQREIAQQLGISEHAVENHVAVAVQRCAEFLHTVIGQPVEYSLLERFRRFGRKLRINRKEPLK